MKRDNALIAGFMAAMLTFVIALTIHVIGLQKDLQANIASQVPNRVANVATWCKGINQGREYARSRANAQHQRDPANFPEYRLKDLPCAKLEAKTQASAK